MREHQTVVMPNVALHTDILSEDLRHMVLVDGDIAGVRGRISPPFPCERYSRRSMPDISTNMGDENPCLGDENPRGRRLVGMKLSLPAI